MSTIAAVQLLVSVNGGAFASGPVTAGFLQTIAMQAASTAPLSSIRYEIYDYPPGMPCPAGWSTDPNTSAYFYAPTNVTTPPPVFSTGASGSTQWGPLMLRLRGNNNPFRLNADGTPNTSYSPQLTDSASVIFILSPQLGMYGIGAGLTTQQDPMRAWVGVLMQAFRALDAAAVGGTFLVDLGSSVSSAQTDVTNPKRVGGRSYNPGDYPHLSATSTILWHVLLETTNAANAANLELSRFSGTGAPAVLATATTTSTTSTEVVVNVSSFFQPGQAPGIFFCNLYLATASSSDAATCSGSWLEITP